MVGRGLVQIERMSWRFSHTLSTTATRATAATLSVVMRMVWGMRRRRGSTNIMMEVVRMVVLVG